MNTVSNDLEGMPKEAVMAYFKTTTQHLVEETDKNHKIVNQDSWCLS
jgi:hypothetical protein